MREVGCRLLERQTAMITHTRSILVMAMQIPLIALKIILAFIVYV